MRRHHVHTIAIAGHICADITPGMVVPTPVEPGRLFDVGPLRIGLGGCVANTAGDLTDLGLPVRVHAAVGDDALGVLVAQQLAERPGILGAPDVAAGQSTSYSLVFEPPGSDRTFWHHIGANRAFDGTGVDVAGVDLLHVGYPSLLPGLLADGGAGLVALLGRARDHGVTTSVDLAVVDPQADSGALSWNRILEEMLPVTDVLSPSIDDLTSALGIDEPPSAALVERLADQLIRLGAAVVAISAGAEGLYLRTGPATRLRQGGRVLVGLADRWADVTLRVPPVPVGHPRTTNGAGDASTAGLLFALVAGASPAQACDLATACSAAVIEGGRTTPDSVIAARPDLAALLVDGVATEVPDQPIVLPANQPADRFYRGGDRIARFRDDGPAVPNTPEDWVGSTTSVRGHGPVGLTALADGTLLVDAIQRCPEAWLGAEHVAAYGSDTKLLVKLLDAGQRLPVHAHPDGAFAHRTLGAAHGKAEAWYILSAGTVHLGLRRDLSTGELSRLVAEQDTDALLGAMHTIPVQRGDRVFVPPGVLHAIGAGVLLAEVQEPEDLSILLEWNGFDLDGEADGHLGLGFDVALEAVETRARSAEEVARLVAQGRTEDASTGTCLPVGSERYFRLARLVVEGESVIEAGLAVLIVIDGAVELIGRAGSRTAIRLGSTVLLPASAGAVGVRGSGTLLVARPPRP